MSSSEQRWWCRGIRAIVAAQGIAMAVRRHGGDVTVEVKARAHLRCQRRAWRDGEQVAKCVHVGVLVVPRRQHGGRRSGQRGLHEDTVTRLWLGAGRGRRQRFGWGHRRSPRGRRAWLMTSRDAAAMKNNGDLASRKRCVGAVAVVAVCSDVLDVVSPAVGVELLGRVTAADVSARSLRRAWRRGWLCGRGRLDGAGLVQGDRGYGLGTRRGTLRCCSRGASDGLVVVERLGAGASRDVRVATGVERHGTARRGCGRGGSIVRHGGAITARRSGDGGAVGRARRPRRVGLAGALPGAQAEEQVS